MHVITTRAPPSTPRKPRPALCCRCGYTCVSNAIEGEGACLARLQDAALLACVAAAVNIRFLCVFYTINAEIDRNFLVFYETFEGYLCVLRLCARPPQLWNTPITWENILVKAIFRAHVKKQRPRKKAKHVHCLVYNPTNCKTFACAQVLYCACTKA